MTGRLIPPFRDFLWPVVCAVRELGGAAQVKQIIARVVEREGFTEEQLAVTNNSRPKMPKVHSWIGFARTRLKEIGVLNNPKRGFWVLTERGHTATEDQILRWYRESERKRSNRS